VRDEPFWLFGGQVETIVMATLVGILGAIARRAPTTGSATGGAGSPPLGPHRNAR
jgi:hypothetical protein